MLLSVPPVNMRCTIHRGPLVSRCVDDFWGGSCLYACGSERTERRADGYEFRNWTICQVVDQLADSCPNCYLRLKWSLTEDDLTLLRV